MVYLLGFKGVGDRSANVRWGKRTRPLSQTGEHSYYVLREYFGTNSYLYILRIYINNLGVPKLYRSCPKPVPKHPVLSRNSPCFQCFVRDFTLWISPVDNFLWPNLWITLKNSVLSRNISGQNLSPKPSFFKDIDMQIFSVVKLLIDNAYEFCPDANVSDEWQRLVYEEFYHQWLNNEVTTLSVTDFLEQRYEAFIAELSTASAKLAPVFSSKHIEKHGNQYRVRITLGNDRIVQNFDDLDAARLFRNEMVKIA